jgi:hypothetical protein
MTQRDGHADEPALASAVRSALTARDAASKVPSFGDSWPSEQARPALIRWRTAFAALAIATVLGALSFALLDPRPEPASAALDPALARELSSEDFWRVPTDELLAHADPAAGIVLPSPRTLEFSLEESLL